MDKCSYFIPGKALFGGYPTQESVNELEDNGVIYFVDLTFAKEKKTDVYVTQYNYIHFPIADHQIPADWFKFTKFIAQICDIIKKLKLNEKLYLHCRGGHGRAGMVVSCILCCLEDITPEEALIRTTQYHSVRANMGDKWRKTDSPRSKYQKSFVHRLFSDLVFYRLDDITKQSYGFSTFSPHPVELIGIGMFPSTEAAYQALKNLNDKEFIDALLNSKTPNSARYIGRKYAFPSDEKAYSELGKIIRLKLEQHPNIKVNLLNTGFRFLHEYESTENNIGKILMEIRNEYI